MENINKNIKSIEIKSKVLDVLKKNKCFKFTKIDTGNTLPFRQDKLFIHQLE